MRDLALVFLLCVSLARSEDLIVNTKEGQVEGIEKTSFYGRPYRAFYGIPYAKPPIGNLRFMDPQDPSGWDGVKKTDKQPEVCMQINTFESFTGSGKPEGSEDCLYLNVFTPYKAQNLPVMVYIHGGGFLVGSAEETNPSTFLDEDVVVVVIQYRLTAFGFISLENDILPGNYGLKDQVKSLEWVKRNIGSFGGNPDSVTIFGQSAGGASVDYLTLTPKSKGLFHKAIAQSGTALNPWAYSRQHRKEALRVAKGVGCDVNKDDKSLKACLQNKSAADIILVTDHNLPTPLVKYEMLPYIDGDFLPESPMNLLQSGNFQKIPRMYGLTRDEGAIFYQFLLKDEAYSKKNFDFLLKLEHEKNVKQIMKKITNRYFGSDDFDLVEHRSEVIKCLGDWYFDAGIEISASFYMKETNLFLYELHHDAEPCPMGDITKGIPEYITHGIDLGFLFDIGGYVQAPLERPQDLELRKTMVKLWVNFARTGNPTPDSSLGFTWELAHKNNNYLQLQPQPEMMKNTRVKVVDFWKSLNIGQYETKVRDEL